MCDYLLVAYYGKYGLRKELFRGTLSECRGKRTKFCKKVGYVYDATEKTIKMEYDIPDGEWTIEVGCVLYGVKIKKAKEDDSYYNTWDTTNEDNLDEKLWGYRYWQEIIEKINQ